MFEFIPALYVPIMSKVVLSIIIGIVMGVLHYIYTN